MAHDPAESPDVGVADTPVRIFFSYRRSDQSDFLDRFYDRLLDEFQEQNVFRDQDSIHAGSRLVADIKEELARTDVVIAVIGPTWSQRLHEERDFVRMEIFEALTHGYPIIPVRLDGTPLPSHDELPHDVRPLLELNAPILRRATDFRVDYQKIAAGVRAEAAAYRDRREAQRTLAAREAEIREKAERVRIRLASQADRSRLFPPEPSTVLGSEHVVRTKSLSFSPDGSQLTSGRENFSDDSLSEVQASRPSTAQKLHRMEGTRFLYSPKGTFIAATSDKRSSLRLYDAQTGKLAHRLKGQPKFVWTMAFSPDESMVALTSDGTIRVWDTQRGRALRTVSGSSRFTDVAFAGDGVLIAASDNEIVVWNPSTGQRALGHSSPFHLPCV